MAKAKRVVTPKFRVSFPALLESRFNELNKKNEFGVMMLFPKDTDLSDLKKLAKETAHEKWGKKIPKGLRSPFRSGNEKYEENGREEYKDCTFINAKTKFKPGVVDANLQPILDSGDVYPGCWGRATITCYAYDTMGNQGVSFSLQNFQKLADDSPFAGGRTKAEDDFDAVEDEDDFLEDDEDGSEEEESESENDDELFG